MKTVTKKLKAWIPDHCSLSPADLAKGEITGLYYSNNDLLSMGWTLAGEAEITVALIDERALVENKVASLREQARNIRAEATANVTRIEGQINDLLAITFDSSVTEAE